MLESLTYTYDANGNRISMDRPSVSLPLPLPASNTSYNSANQMLSSNDKNITYDENGNMTSVTNSCGTTNYTWDARNRLIGIQGYKPTCTSLSVSFAYDAIGRRIEKTINGRTIQYVYDGLDIVQEIENGLPSVNYIRTLNIDEPLARIKTDGTVRYYQTDVLGSVITLTDDIGTVQTTYAYDPFGNVVISGEASDNPFQYTGRENDNTGLYYYRARYYYPELQRFISEDPIGLAGGINLFAYVGNQPTNSIDPVGFKGCGPGSGWQEKAIPDYPYGLNFKPCCDAHDDCYACEGKYAGKNYSKGECDLEFCICLFTKNISFPPIPAITYCYFVVKHGDNAFKKARHRPRPK